MLLGRKKVFVLIEQELGIHFPSTSKSSVGHHKEDDLVNREAAPVRNFYFFFLRTC